MAHRPSRTRFYRDKRNAKFLGVCSGVADYTGFDVTLVRLMFALLFLMTGFAVVPFYFIVAWIADDKPRELERSDPDDNRFWQQVRASPARGAHDIRARLRDVDRRLADVETYVTDQNRTLAREIEQLR